MTMASLRKTGSSALTGTIQSSFITLEVVSKTNQTTMELQERLVSLQRELSTPRQIAFYRIKLLSLENDDGHQPQACLASLLVPLLKDSLSAWLAQPIIQGALLSSLVETVNLRSILQLHLHVTKMNPSLGEELGRQGSHAPLVKLMNLDLAEYENNGNRKNNGEETTDIDEANEDTVIELQDLACEIAALASSFPVKVAPFCAHGLRQRLPLVFSIGAVVDAVQEKSGGVGHEDEKKSSEDTEAETETVLIHQVTTRQSAQEDVGFVMWPSAVVLSQWLVTNPSVVRGHRVLEIGAGCGLTGLVAARLQKEYAKEIDNNSDLLHQEVILSDFNTTVLQNLERNAELNNVETGCSVVGLDFYEQSGTASHWKDMNGELREQVDVVLAADMICQPADAVGAANTVHDALRPGGRAVVVCADSEHRFGVEIFESECHRVGLEIKAQDVGDMYDGKLYSSGGMEQTAGFVEGMSLTMFFIEKALQ